ncbi:MAG: MFS transporter [Thermomicrobiales bacterium]|nr:MFS transporter [Thermomicrobiales bacterium]
MFSNRAMEDGLNNPVSVYVLLMAGQALCFSLFFTVQLVYHVTVIGLSPLQLVLIGTVLEVTCFVFETPTGIVADLYSRRLSVLIGIALIGLAYVLEGGIPAFWTAMTAQLLWGIGYTFTSGATEAWLVDEIGAEAAGPVFLRGRQAWLIGIIIGTPAAVGLALIQIQTPMVSAGIVMLLMAVTLRVLMREHNWSPAPPEERSTLSHMRGQLREGWHLAMARPVVRTIILISLVAGLAAEAFDRLSIAFSIEQFSFPALFGRNDPIIWFGLNGLVATFLGLAASELFKRRGARALGSGDPARLLALCAGGQVMALIVFALSGSLLMAFAMFWVRTIISVIHEPVELAWLNRHLDSSTRATVISMTGQANAIGQASGGPMYGWVGGAVSLRAALLLSAAVLAPTIALYNRLRKPVAER